MPSRPSSRPTRSTRRGCSARRATAKAQATITGTHRSPRRSADTSCPRALRAPLSAKADATLLFPGQLTGGEGYPESAATGILAGINLVRLLGGDAPVVPPPTTMLGALYRYVHSADPAHFQPMNANFGLVDPLERPVKDKQKKRELLVQRALHDIDIFARGVGVEVTA